MYNTPAKIQTNHYTKSALWVSVCLISWSDRKTQSWCWLFSNAIYTGFKMAELHTVQIMRLFLIINPQLPKLMITCKVTNEYPNKKSSDRMMREAKSQMNYQSDLAFVQAVWSRPRHVTLQNVETRSLSLSQRSKEKKTHQILITLDPQSLSLEKP